MRFHFIFMSGPSVLESLAFFFPFLSGLAAAATGASAAIVWYVVKTI